MGVLEFPDELEFARQPRTPLFLLFTSITTHMPFVPTPPYQSDWPRLLSDQPFAASDVAGSLAQVPDWNSMGRDYAQSMGYALTTMAGYLRQHAGRDLVMIVLGDHQPAANVAGENASWDVPVHVIADRAELVAPLLRHGFHKGLTPLRPGVGGMHELVPMLTDAFETPRSREVAPAD